MFDNILAVVTVIAIVILIDAHRAEFVIIFKVELLLHCIRER